MRYSLRILTFSALLLLAPVTLLADGMHGDPGMPGDPSEREPQNSRQKSNRVPAERIDKRLPPVVPGQSVQAGGKSHKVISSAGPVPVSPAPQAPAAPSQPTTNTDLSTLGGVSVIVDKRSEGGERLEGE